MSLVASSLITLADSAINGISADEQNEKSTYSLPANQMLTSSGRSLLRVPGTAAGAYTATCTTLVLLILQDHINSIIGTGYFPV